MDWDEVQRTILADLPEPGELVYLARHGQDYRWCVVEPAAPPPHAAPEAPDAWLFYTGRWPAVDPGPFFVDLRAELESMTGGADRCRWPLDEPWPHSH